MCRILQYFSELTNLGGADRPLLGWGVRELLNVVTQTLLQNLHTPRGTLLLLLTTASL